MEKSEDSRTFAHAQWTSPVRKGNEGLRDRSPVRRHLNPLPIRALNPLSGSLVEETLNRPSKIARVGGVREEETGPPFQLPDRMDPRRHHGQPGGNGLEGDEGKSGPHEPIRKYRDLRDPVRGPQFLSGKEASNDDEFVSTDTGPHDQRFGVRPIPEQQDDLSRRVPRKPMHQPKHVAHPSGFLRRTCENHASASGREDAAEPRAQVGRSAFQEKRIERMPDDRTG